MRAIDPAQVIRAHRAALVRLSRIAEVRRTPTRRRELILQGATRISAGRVHAKPPREVLLERDASATAGRRLRVVEAGGRSG